MFKSNKFIYTWIFLVFLITVLLYEFKFSEKAIYNNAVKQNGYKLFEILKPAHFTASIDPNWIPTNENEVLKLNKEVGEVGNVKIIIESVTHRGNDIYFNFDAKQFIKYNSGEFFSNDEINEDGTFTSYNLIDSFRISNKDTIIDIGQRGWGPSAKFSFGINIENYDLISDGFTLEYNGSILYGYSLVD